MREDPLTHTDFGERARDRESSPQELPSHQLKDTKRTSNERQQENGSEKSIAHRSSQQNSNPPIAQLRISRGESKATQNGSAEHPLKIAQAHLARKTFGERKRNTKRQRTRHTNKHRHRGRPIDKQRQRKLTERYRRGKETKIENACEELNSNLSNCPIAQLPISHSCCSSVAMAYSPFGLCIAVVVVALLLAIGVATAYERAGLGYVQKSHMWKTCHSSIPYGWLLGLRIVAFLYCLSILIYDIVLWGPFVFEYYTQWSFTLLIIYFGIAIGSSIKEIVRYRNSYPSPSTDTLLSGYPEVDEENESGVAVLSASSYYQSSEEAGMDGYILQILYQIALGAAFLTDLVYWTCIFPTYSFVDVIEISMHAVNLVFLLGELALNNMTFHWFRGAYFIIWTAVFIFFTWIIHALGEREWQYSFLDVSANLAPLWYFLLCVVHLAAYAFVCLIIYLKQVCLSHCEPSQT